MSAGVYSGQSRFFSQSKNMQVNWQNENTKSSITLFDVISGDEYKYCKIVNRFYMLKGVVKILLPNIGDQCSLEP